jgi:hypothetical protein
MMKSQLVFSNKTLEFIVLVTKHFFFREIDVEIKGQNLRKENKIKE